MCMILPPHDYDDMGIGSGGSIMDIKLLKMS